jgi:cell fate regulator YaaT (PSP1 superfamily)
MSAAFHISMGAFSRHADNRSSEILIFTDMSEGGHICGNRGNLQEASERVQSGCSKLAVHDWLQDIPGDQQFDGIIEVRFKNTRKGFYRNIHGLRFRTGDVVAVEASPGHDIGVVSMTGELVLRQLFKHGVDPASEDLKKAYRKAKTADIEKWKEAIELEHNTMIRSRQIAADLKLDMKIGDVEYQGDRTKAIFYYIADERVDFRELIKVLADAFRVRIEMRQIGARQEAGRIGGIGSCGRELCCASWMTSFVSVTTNAARYQEVSLNPQKLAGQCGKLKCCLNYELSSYVDAQKDFPDRNAVLETENGEAYYQKTDIYRGLYWYGSEKENASDMTPVPVERVREIIRINREGRKVKSLLEQDSMKSRKLDFQNDIVQDDLTRFDSKKPKGKRKKKRKKKNPDRT